MLSPAKASFLRKTAALASGAGPVSGPAPIDENDPVATEYAALLASLGNDLRTLQNIQSIERKIEAKRAMAPAYLPWVKGALESETPRQDEIVVTMLVWAIDLGQWEDALKLAEHVLTHGLALPERYKRHPATLIAEEFAEAGIKDVAAIHLDDLLAVQRLTDPFDMHDQVRAKLLKALGLSMKDRIDHFDAEAESAIAGGKSALIDAALGYFRAALAKDEKSGVKTLIRDIERDAKKASEPEPE